MTLDPNLLALFHFVRLLSQLIRVKFQSLTVIYTLKLSDKYLNSLLAAFINKKAKCYALKVQNRNIGKVCSLIQKIAPTFQTDLLISGTKALSTTVTAMDEVCTTRAAYCQDSTASINRKA